MSIAFGDCFMSASRNGPEKWVQGTNCGPIECNRRTLRGSAVAASSAPSEMIPANKIRKNQLIPRGIPFGLVDRNYADDPSQDRAAREDAAAIPKAIWQRAITHNSNSGAMA